MRTATRLFSAIGKAICIGMLALATLKSGPALAQGAAAATPPRTAAQLEQLVAPIALYPDSLLSQILMASTYPLEVVAAARWSQTNPSVTGDALQSAMAQQPWDPSVKALTAVPQTLQMMNDKLDWTQQLGDAFLAQQSDILDAVQRLRARADANGTLKSTPQQKVTVTARPAGQQAAATAPASVYAIEPATPDEYYVPIYNPSTVYGAWPYPDYEPFYWYPPGYAYGNAFSFAAGALVGSAIWGNVNWGADRVQINAVRYNNFNRTNISDTNWNHNPAHRGTVPYRDAGVAQRFGNQGQSAAREGFRNTANAGREQLGNGRQQPGGPQGQAGAANKAKQAAGAKTGAGGKQAANAKNAAGAKQAANTKKGAGTNQAANAKKDAGSKQAANAKKAAGNKQAANTKKAAGNKQAANTKKATPNKQAGTKQAARPQQGAGNRQAAGNPGTRSRAQNVNRPGGGGGGARPGGGGGARAGGGGGRGRRSDVRLKHDLLLLGHLDNGLGFYRFAYNGSEKTYVGVIAQEVQAVMPQAVARDRDGYLRVFYDKLGVTFQTYDHWVAAGARVPEGPGASH